MSNGSRLMGAFAVAALLAATHTTAAAARTAGGLSVAYCEYNATFWLDPGVTTIPGTFRFTTRGERAEVHCQGQINGATVTGPGAIGEDGVINQGNCVSGSGTGSYSAHVPTTAGAQHITGTFRLMYEGLAGTEVGDTVSATFTYVPTKGNCLTTPMTQFWLQQLETLYTPT